MVTPDLLATVDERDWAAVSSASGPATGVPALLRAVAAGVEPAADEAVVQLIDELHDPGTSWTATAPTVPFLVELALAPTVPHRGSLLYLLARLSMVDLVEVIELGPALAAPLTPLIRTLLTSKVRWRQVAAARALHRLGAADVDEVLAVILPPPTAFEYWQHHAARAAVDLVVELRATQAAQRLTAYLDGKVRIRFGTTNDRIRDDERLRERIRQALATLPG